MQTGVMDGMAGGELLGKPTLERGCLQGNGAWNGHVPASPASSMWSFQWCLRKTQSCWDSHQYHSLQPACIHPHSPIPIHVSQAVLLAAPIPVPTTAATPCPLELGTMGRGSPGWETEELRLQCCHRQEKGNFRLKMKEKQYKSHNPAQFLGFRVGLVFFSPSPNPEHVNVSRQG